MKKGTVLNLRNCNKFLEFLKINNLLLCLTAFFIIGLVVGIFTIEKYSLLEDWANRHIINFINFRIQAKFLKIVFKSFFGSMLFLLLSFISGTSICGVILVPLTVSLNGCLYGAVSAVLYAEYSLKGIAFHAVILLPSAIIFTIALILSACESVRFSLVVAKLTLPTSIPSNLSFNFKNYCVRYLLLSLLVLFSAIIDAVISGNFLNSFSLF